MPPARTTKAWQLSEEELPIYGPRIAAIEKAITYPLGDDRFSIDHGADYFAFFRRLGDLTYVLATRGETVAGGIAAMRRQIPCSVGPDAPTRDAWYLGDLKVTTEGRGLARRLLRTLEECEGPRRAYGVSMNPGSGARNVVAQLLARLHPEVRICGTLNFYTGDARRIEEVLPILRAHRGDIGFLSLAGKKDIVLASTGQPMALAHVQFGPFAEGSEANPRPGFAHMFCAPDGDPLDTAVRRMGMAPMATATIAGVGMQNIDWGFVLSSDV